MEESSGNRIHYGWSTTVSAAIGALQYAFLKGRRRSRRWVCHLFAGLRRDGSCRAAAAANVVDMEKVSEHKWHKRVACGHRMPGFERFESQSQL